MACGKVRHWVCLRPFDSADQCENRRLSIRWEQDARWSSSRINCYWSCIISHCL